MFHRDLRAIGVTLVAALTWSACSSPEEQFADHMRRGDELAANGEAEGAILEYRSALRIIPESADVNERISAQLMRRGDPSGVVYLEDAVRLAPDRADLKGRLARLLLTLNRRDAAEQLIQAALEAHPEAAEIHAANAELLLYKADTAGALAAAEKATSLAPDDPAAWIQLGRVHVGRIREAVIQRKEPPAEWYDAALSAFRRGDELGGGIVSARIEQAQVLGMRDATQQEAGAAFQSAVVLAGEQGDRAVEMETAKMMETFAESTEMTELQRWALRRMIELDDSQILLWKKLADLSRDDEAEVDPADAIYAELLERRPDDAEAHMLYSAHLVEQGERQQAMQHMREVITETPDSPQAWEQLVRLELNLKRYRKARSTFVRMSDEFPDSPITRRAEARIALAEARSEDAVAILRALGAKGRQFETQRLLALAEYRSGNLANAAAAIERALALEDDFTPEALRLKARIQHDSGEWQQSLVTFAAMARRGEPLSQRDHLMRARAFYETGRPELGRRLLGRLLQSPNPIPGVVVEFYEREGKTQGYRAASHLIQSLQKQPWHPALVEASVDMELTNGRPAEALQHLDAAIQSGRARPETLLLRARVLTEMNELDRAEADALRAFEADPELPGAVDLIYAIYRAEDRLDEARKSFEEAERAGVLHAGAQLLLGRIYLEQGQKRLAKHAFEQILREHPDFTAAKNDLAYLLAEENRDLDRALELAEEAQQAMSTDPNTADTVGYVYYRRGLHEAALQQFQYALELNRNRHHHRDRLEPTLHYHMGLTLDALERDQEAAESYRRALELDADFPNAEDARRRIEAMGQASPTAPQTS